MIAKGTQHLTIALAQMNQRVGDLEGNAAAMLEMRRRAKHADLLLCPELQVIGYPPEDLVLRESFAAASERALVDLAAIRANVAAMKAGTPAEVMAVVKADGYGHGLVPSAQAALAGGATWLGTAIVDEALALRAAGITAPVLAWLHAPGTDFASALRADVQIAVSSVGQLCELLDAAHRLLRCVPSA